MTIDMTKVNEISRKLAAAGLDVPTTLTLSADTMGYMGFDKTQIDKARKPDGFSHDGMIFHLLEDSKDGY